MLPSEIILTVSRKIYLIHLTVQISVALTWKYVDSSSDRVWFHSFAYLVKKKKRIFSFIIWKNVYSPTEINVKGKNLFCRGFAGNFLYGHAAFIFTQNF